MFHLNVIPVANMTRDFSNPVLCDGTRERYRLRSKTNDDAQEIMTIEGVYKTSANELHPLAPGVIEEKMTAMNSSTRRLKPGDSHGSTYR